MIWQVDYDKVKEGVFQGKGEAFIEGPLSCIDEKLKIAVGAEIEYQITKILPFGGEIL